jgi:uncharacterized membrane protein
MNQKPPTRAVFDFQIRVYDLSIMYFIEIIVIAVLVIAVFRLSARVSEVERQLRGQDVRAGDSHRLAENGLPLTSKHSYVQHSGKKGGTQAGEALASGALRDTSSVVSAPYIDVPKDNSLSQPTVGERFAAWFKEDWMLKLGAFILLLGFVWLATYAFMHNWIGPVGRITLGIFAGAGLLAFGWYRMRSFIHQGSIFLGLGSSVIILTLFAARNLYGFFTPFSALAIMFLSVAFVALASVKYRVQSLALTSIIIAALTPHLIGSGGLTDMSLFLYLFLIVLGTVWIVALTGWRTLLVAGLMLVTFYSIPQWIYGPASGLLMIVYAFSAVFFIVGTLGIIKSDIKESLADFIVAAGNGAFLLVWILNAVPKEWQSLVIAAWLVVFAVGGFMVFRITRHPAPFLLYASVATALLAAATAVELQGASLTIAYIIEATLIPLVIYILLRNLKTVERAGLLLIIPAFLALPSIFAREWMSGVFHQHFFVLFLMTLAFFIVGLFIWSKKSESAEPLVLYSGYIVGGLAFGYVLIWLVLHAAIPDGYFATMLSLLIYLIIGLVRYFYGKINRNSIAKLHGGILVIFVVAHLLIIDVWAMEMGGRIVTFFLLGALLMATAFVGRGKKLPEPGVINQ